MRDPDQRPWDVLVIGSGIGGVMAALSLARAGARVLMLERGGWAPAPAGESHPVWDFFQLGAGYDEAGGYRVSSGGREGAEGIWAAVGGAAAVYGGVSYRLRDEDFAPPAEIVGDSGARWPLEYADLEPWYAEAERALGVAGDPAGDPTEPSRSAPYPRAPAALSPIGARLAGAARRLGLHPSRVPLALSGELPATACDGYPLAAAGRADLASRLVRGELMASPNFELRTRQVVTRLVMEGERVAAVETVDKDTGERGRWAAERVVLAAGALATPHLLLASGVEARSTAPHAVGRYLMRHCNAFVYGFFPRLPGAGAHHKQVAVNDFYSLPDGRGGRRKLGNLQQVMHPQLGGVLRVPARALRGSGAAGRGIVAALAAGVRPLAHRMTGLQVIAEDQPRAANRVELEGGAPDRWGMPRARVVHDYTARDLAARAELVAHARRILREAGALPWQYVFPVTTFSHAVGTVRMGDDPTAAPLDRDCRFRGLANLWVADGSVFPTSGGLNPSLTIAANALRVGSGIAAR